MSCMTWYVTVAYPEARIPNRCRVPEAGAVTVKLPPFALASWAPLAAAYRTY